MVFSLLLQIQPLAPHDHHASLVLGPPPDLVFELTCSLTCDFSTVNHGRLVSLQLLDEMQILDGKLSTVRSKIVLRGFFRSRQGGAVLQISHKIGLRDKIKLEFGEYPGAVVHIKQPVSGELLCIPLVVRHDLQRPLHRDIHGLLDTGPQLFLCLGILSVRTCVLGLVAFRDLFQTSPRWVVAVDVIDLQDRAKCFDESEQLVAIEDCFVADQSQSAVLCVVLDGLVDLSYRVLLRLSELFYQIRHLRKEL